MFSFFNNILTTLTDGKSFDRLSRASIRRARSTIDRDKLSDIETRIFGIELKRQKGESFFAYLDRRSILSKLSLEDKQRIIASEKKRLIAEEKRKRSMLDDYLTSSKPNKTKAQVQSNEVQDKISQVLQKRLNSLDSAIFHSLASRQEQEPLFPYLKRSKKLYRLPVEDTLKIVHAEKSRVEQEKIAQQKLLNKYLRPTGGERVLEIGNASSDGVENALNNTRANRSKGVSV